jgi:DHA1 family tetracycline resistance protein-like MFS transporter
LADAALCGGILSAAQAVMQFGFSPALATISDRVGRRPVLLTSMAVAGIAVAAHPTALANMADISNRSKRAQNFVFILEGGRGVVHAWPDGCRRCR